MTAANIPRFRVEPPAFVPRQFGLLSTVDVRIESDPHWLNGVWWQQTCDIGGLYAAVHCVTGLGATKGANVEREAYAAHPTIVLVEIECSAVGYDPAEQNQDALDALARVEEYQLESAFWTGTAGAVTNAVYPHLASNAQVLDSAFSASQSVVVQLAATNVSASGLALDIAEGLGRLEDALGDCVPGQGVIHMTLTLADIAQSRGLLIERNGRKYTVAGNRVVIGAGYPGTSPTGTTVAGVHYMYATGPVFVIRGDPAVLGEARVSDRFDLATNTMHTIAERTFVVGYACCLFTVPISLGGVVSGAANSAT